MPRPTSRSGRHFSTTWRAYRKAQCFYEQIARHAGHRDPRRTAVLGGYIEQCDRCDFTPERLQPGRNRHRPAPERRTRPVAGSRKAELLPVEYFHVASRCPNRSLRSPSITKRRSTVFCSAPRRETYWTIARDPKHLGAEIGFFAISYLGAKSFASSPSALRWCPAVSRRIRNAGSVQARILSCPCACSRNCSGARFGISGRRIYKTNRGFPAASTSSGCFRLRRIPACARKARMGRLRQAAVRRTAARAGVSGPLHASGRHLQPSAALTRRRTRNVSVSTTGASTARNRRP